MAPNIFVTYTSVDAIRSGDRDISLTPLKAVVPEDSIDPARLHLRFFAGATRHALLGVLSLFQAEPNLLPLYPTEEQQAIPRLQRAAAMTGCRKDPYKDFNDLDVQHSRQSLVKLWRGSPAPDIVFILGAGPIPSSDASKASKHSDASKSSDASEATESQPTPPLSSSGSMLPLAIIDRFPPLKGPTWHPCWDHETAFEGAVAFHLQSQTGQGFIFLPGMWIGQTYGADETTRSVIMSFLKVTLFHEMIHLTRTLVFGIQNALTPERQGAVWAQPQNTDVPKEKKRSEAGLEAEVLAFGAPVSLYLNRMEDPEDPTIYDKAIRGCYHNPDGKAYTVSVLRLEELFLGSAIPIPVQYSHGSTTSPIASNIRQTKHLRPLAVVPASYPLALALRARIRVAFASCECGSKRDAPDALDAAYPAAYIAGYPPASSSASTWLSRKCAGLLRALHCPNGGECTDTDANECVGVGVGDAGCAHRRSPSRSMAPAPRQHTAHAVPADRRPRSARGRLRVEGGLRRVRAEAAVAPHMGASRALANDCEPRFEFHRLLLPTAALVQSVSLLACGGTEPPSRVPSRICWSSSTKMCVCRAGDDALGERASQCGAMWSDDVVEHILRRSSVTCVTTSLGVVPRATPLFPAFIPASQCPPSLSDHWCMRLDDK
ncbi:hypothetical protein GGX14DRAFT_558366 [Mycena pura]|uniref:Uncharacterized protein n=1 Tax=Mycena pura TaxID=153505 RepID=A0AAD6VVX2_9AGAR|nr:hypothetical protein GGX14DRAFT_558366 [Mycena pura]